MPSGSPPFLAVCGWLEVEAQAELNPARSGSVAVSGNQLGGNDAKAGPLVDIQARVDIVDVVEDVEEIGGKAHREFFRNCGLLSE